MSSVSFDIQRLNSEDQDFSEKLDRLCHWHAAEDPKLTATVAAVLDKVRRVGDAALLDLTARFDRFPCERFSDLVIGAVELERTFTGLSETEAEALVAAAANIREYHLHQKLEPFSYQDATGNHLGQRVRPLERVGVYVPGGQAAYPSTVLMTVIPAKLAGVSEIVMVVPTPEGRRNSLLLAAAHVAGVDQVITIGGAQAIAALAYGTQSLSRVDKIVGPGGSFVAEAKRQVFGPVGIDGIAGPSEILIIADGTAPAEWVVWDLFSQAEHDPVAQALLVSPDAAYLKAVQAKIGVLLPTLEREKIVRSSLQNRGALILATSLEEAVEIANRVAPEHLELAVAAPEPLLDKVRHAGAIFLGSYSTEAFGDYAAGPSHVLPTNGTARFASPLSVYDFLKRTSIIHCSPSGSQTLARTASVLARGEGLEAHARAAELRLQNYDANQSP